MTRASFTDISWREISVKLALAMIYLYNLLSPWYICKTCSRHDISVKVALAMIYL
jgi:hypothetical protein